MIKWVNIGNPIWGILFQQKEGPEFYRRIARLHGDYLRFRFGPIRAHMISNPEMVREILIKNQDVFIKGSVYSPLRLLLGQGLLTSDGRTWKAHREVAQNAFRQERILELFPILEDGLSIHMKRLQNYADTGQSFDLFQEMTKIFLDTIIRLMFGTEVESEWITKVSESFQIAIKELSHRMSTPVKLPLWIPTNRNRKLTNAIQTLHKCVDEMIETKKKRRQSNSDKPNRPDFLSLLAEYSELWTTEETRDEILTFIAAGHETSASTLGFALMHSSEQDAVASELTSESLGISNPFSSEGWKSLRRSRAFIEETLRLYPPIWLYVRQAERDFTFHNLRIRKRQWIGILPYVLHRDSRWWTNPDVFDYTRFLGDGSSTQKRSNAYIPFSTGPRSCLGAGLAQIETTLVLSEIVKRFKIEVLNRQDFRLSATFTLKPKHPIYAKVHANTLIKT